MSFMGDLKFCCDSKRKLLTNNALFDCLTICPKYIIFKKHAKTRCLKKTVTIKNNHTVPRTISFGNDFPCGLSIDCPCEVTLLPEESHCLEVYCEPAVLKRQSPSRESRYRLFLYEEHPKLTIEVPVLYEVGTSEVSCPLDVKMADTSPNVRCYYAFPVYNPTDNAVSLQIGTKGKLQNLRYMPCQCEIGSRDYCMIYLEAISENMCPVLVELILRFSKEGIKKIIRVEAQMVPYMLHVSDVVVRFPLTKLGMRSDKCILLCNESEEIIKFKWCRKESKERSSCDQDQTKPMNTSHIKEINKYFQIRPKNGFYTPNSSESAMISFTPPAEMEEECDVPPFEFEANAYLACSSNINRRLKVTLIGLAEGASVEFISTEVDLGTVFVGERRCKEVTATNTGSIPANVNYIGTDNSFGGVASSSPHEQLIDPLQSVQFSITYYAKSVGKFMEKIFFQIRYGKRLTILLKGCAVPLSIDISPKKIDFGDIPLCVLRKQYLTIVNSLKVPAVITAKVMNNGEDDPLILSVDEEKLEEEIAEDNDDIKSYISTSFSETQSDTHFTFWAYNSKTQCGEIMENVCSPRNGLPNENDMSQHSSERTFREESKTATSGETKCTCGEESKITTSVKTQESEEDVFCSSDSKVCPCERSSSSPSDTKSKMTLEFNDVLDNASIIAENLVSAIKANKILEESEPNAKVVEVAFNELFNYEYFKERRFEGDYQKRTWSGLPSNPREIMMQTGPFYVDPQKSVDILVYLVSNKAGPFTRNIYLRITPYSGNFDSEESDAICSRALSMSVPVTYNCIIPTLHLSEEIIHIETYVNYKQPFFFRVKSLSSVDGFFYFNIIPRNEDVELLLNPRKSYIKAGTWRKIHGRVTVFKVGKTVLRGNICAFGCARPIVYTVIINAKPPEIKICPSMLNLTQRVLTTLQTPVRITNVCPAPATVSLSMENTNFVSVEPNEATLGADQCLEVTLTSYFYDNGSYKNKLIVSLMHSGVTKIPSKYTVQGIPIEFNPNIRENFDMGMVFTSQKPYKTDLLVINHGFKPYKVFIKKVKNQPKAQLTDCTGFEIDPRAVNINPQETQKAIISIKSTNKTTVEEEFSVDASQGTDSKKIHDFNFFCKAAFVRSLIKWSKDEIVFDIRNSELCEKKGLSEKVDLINSSKIPAHVELTVVGSYTIFDPCKRIYGDKFKFSLEPSKSREFEVFFDKKHEASEKLSAIYEGKVVTTAADRLQKCLLLTTRMIYPAIEVDEEELYYFARKQQFFAFFKITNPGILAAVYKWQLIEEVEIPLNFVHTKKMREQKNLTQELLSSKSSNLLTLPIDVEEEYLQSMSKFINTFEESSDESETEKSSTTETSSDTAVRKGKKIKPNKKTSSESVRDVKRKKPKKGSKQISKESLKQKTKTKTANEESKNKKPKSKKSRKKSESTIISERAARTNSSILSSVIEDNIINKYPLELVTQNELVEEVGSFLKDNFTEDYIENICEKLAPLESFEEECPCKDKYLFLDHYKGLIGSENCKLMNLFFSGHDREVVHKAKYELEVAAGNSTTVDIVVYNHRATLEISETKYDFGCQPWYKVHQRKIKLTNRNNLNFKVAIVENAYLEKYHKLYKGFVTVNPHGVFYMLDNMICEFTIKVYMGFSSEFKDGFGVEINNNMPVPVTFSGKSAIPMLTILNVDRPLLSTLDRNLEYKTLNKIFLNEVYDIAIPEVPPTKYELCKLHKELEKLVDEISHVSLDEFNCLEEEMEEMSEDFLHDTLPKLKDLYIGKEGRVLKFKDTKNQHRATVISRLDPDVRDYEVCDYPEEYPKILYIEKMIETNKFLESVKVNEDVQEAFRTIATKHVLEGIKIDYDRHCKRADTIKIRSFIVHPLPFNTTTYYLPFDYIRLNEELLVTLELFFHGPGKAVFSARTSTAIPGLEVEFCAPVSGDCFDSAMDISSNRKFLIYNTKPVIKPVIKYIPKIVRDNLETTLNCKDCEKCSDCCEAKLCHAHSYDLDLNKVHRRDLPNRKMVNEHYTKLNQQQYKEEKDAFVLSELFQEDCESVDDTLFMMKIKFSPTEEFYEAGSLFEDFILIDVHLGPTIPILVRGPITASDYVPQETVTPTSSEDSGLDSK